MRKSADALGSRLEHWAVLRHAPTGLKMAGQLLARLCLGLVPPEVIDVHAVGEIIATVKPSGGLRPIQLSSILRRIAVGALVKRSSAEVAAFAGEIQLGIGQADGCAKAFQTISSLARADSSRVVMALDVKSAHQAFSRAKAAMRPVKSISSVVTCLAHLVW